MSAAVSETLTPEPPAPPKSGLAKVIWHWRHNAKAELWLAWFTIIVFYNFFGVCFFGLTRTQPPPPAWWSAERVVQWFDRMHEGLLVGFGIVFLIGAFSVASTALIVYSIRRMSVSPAFGWAYLILYSLAAVPGMLLTCIALVVGAMRPDRDPQLISLLYDMGFLSFSGTMGIFLVGSVVWAIAIIIDKNRVLPKWFGYLNICNALTEVVVATCWILKTGPFAWNGVISFYINMVVFAAYTGVFITLLQQMILREDFGTGVLPPLARAHARAVRAKGRVVKAPANAAVTPGQPDMWVLVLVEALTFSAYFVVYTVCRSRHPELYLQAQAHLNREVGVANTLLLLTSSWSMARCVQRVRAADYKGALANVWLTLGLGVIFACAKLYEWSVEVGRGLYFSTNEFFSFYYFLTGMHLLHVLVGFVVLGVVIYQLRSPARRSQEIIETGATYWHMVDFLWVMIFALLYVMR